MLKNNLLFRSRPKSSKTIEGQLDGPVLSERLS